MELTESNKLFTYLERCRMAARLFRKTMDDDRFDVNDQEWVSQTIADSYQVETIDMLAETNTSWT